MNAWLQRHPWWGAIGIVGGFIAIGTLFVILAGGGGGAPAAAPAPSSPAGGPAGSDPAGVALDIAVFDDTERRPPGERLEIWVRGHGSWFPDLRFGSDVNVLGTFPVGRDGTFALYPDGREGREIRVPFRMTAAMISGSDRDRTQVEIHDQQVVVRGAAIPAGPLTFAR